MLHYVLPFAALCAACTPAPQEPPMTNAIQGTGQSADNPEAAQGRRTLSAAYVRIGPDGHLTVELKDGRVLVLRDVKLGQTEYCGTAVSGVAAGSKFCGGFAAVAAARPGGAPLAEPAGSVTEPVGPAKPAT